MYTTYILFSSKINKYYTGHTMNLENRMLEHNRGKTPFMARGIPWVIVFTQNHNSRSEAIKLEEIIKKRGAERYLYDLKKQNG